jgi:phosphoribosylamine--glycine ligase
VSLGLLTVCVVGAGGREHALAHALARTSAVVACPGNPGIAAEGIECAPGAPEDVVADLFVIGPEVPLVDGLADRLRRKGRLVFGPGADGARLEGSKEWMKEVVREAGVPTARSAAFGPGEEDAALGFLRTLPGLYVVKTDGLAAGKGVLVTGSIDEAGDDVRAKLSGAAFGDAGRRVVIEEGLTGPELSVLAVCDGNGGVAVLPPAQDHKRLDDGDRGPNTGGMGALSPVPGVGRDLETLAAEKMVAPTLDVLARRGIDYRGVLYAGLMGTPDGPKLLEFNVRFGDPECQVVVPRLQGDVAGLLHEAASGHLRSGFRTDDDACVCVVLASAGYPRAPVSGRPITGVEEAGAIDGVTVYHAGTAAAPDGGGGLVTSGGRVLNVVARAASLREARDLAYRAAALIDFEGMQYRTDIAAEASRWHKQ